MFSLLQQGYVQRFSKQFISLLSPLHFSLNNFVKLHRFSRLCNLSVTYNSKKYRSEAYIFLFAAVCGIKWLNYPKQTTMHCDHFKFKMASLLIKNCKNIDKTANGQGKNLENAEYFASINYKFLEEKIPLPMSIFLQHISCNIAFDQLSLINHIFTFCNTILSRRLYCKLLRV